MQWIVLLPVVEIAVEVAVGDLDFMKLLTKHVVAVIVCQFVLLYTAQMLVIECRPLHYQLPHALLLLASYFLANHQLVMPGTVAGLTQFTVTHQLFRRFIITNYY